MSDSPEALGTGHSGRKSRERGSGDSASRIGTAACLLFLFVLLSLSVSGAWWFHRELRQAPILASYTIGHRDLLAAYADDYPIDPRLSSTTAGLRVQRKPRNEIAFSFVAGPPEDRLRAEAVVEREAARTGSPEARSAAGVRWLLSRSVDRAIEDLEAARLQLPGDSRILNDLASAYLVRGKEQEHPLDLREALVLLARAVRLDPEAVEPRFNLALALDTAGLRGPAEAAWEAYLHEDRTDSRWTQSARRRLGALQTPSRSERWDRLRADLRELASLGREEELHQLRTKFPERSRDEAERWLFEDWPRAVLDGDREKEADLRRALRNVASAAPPQDAVLRAAIDDLEIGSPIAIAALARGYLDLGRAHADLARFDFMSMSSSARRALRMLQKVDSPYTGRALYLVALARYQEASYGQAAADALAAQEHAKSVMDPFTVAQSLQLLGVMASVDYRYEEALDWYASALATSRTLRWKNQVASAESSMGEVLGLIGDEEAAWRHRWRVLTETEESYRGWVRMRSLLDATDSLAEETPQVARYFADELIGVAQAMDAPTTSVAALRLRAEVASRNDDARAAVEDLDAAEVLVDGLSNRAQADVLSGNLLKTRGEVLLPERPQEAIRALDDALSHYKRTDYTVGLPWVLEVRARARRSVGDEVGAVADLESALERVEEAAARLKDPIARAAQHHSARRTYDGMVSLQVAQGRPDRALEFVERSQWALRPAETDDKAVFAIGPPRPPRGGAAIVYRALGDQIVIWVIQRQRTDTVLVPISKEELRARIDEFRRSIQWGSGADTVAQEMYRLLLSPVISLLEHVTELVLVLDPPLDQIPFGALVNPSSAHALLEDFSITESPSVRALAWGDSREWQVESSSPVLAVASRGLGHGRVSDLPLVEAETQEIARRFPRTTLLTGGAASRDRVLAESTRHAIFHFAGHALPNESNPLLSSLSLPLEAGNQERLFAYQVLNANLGNLGLAVLSACGTSAGGGGTSSLAGAFIEAGVPTVVATRWEVSDKLAAAFFQRFYEGLARSGDAVGALRHAQLALRSSRDPDLNRPAGWAAFALLRSGQ